jgi:predicted transcriptional regulator
LKLTDIITKEVPMLNKNRTLLDALESLNKGNLESIAICDEKKPVGTLSYRDILFRVGAQRLRAVSPASLYVSGFVKDFPATLSNDTPIRRAAKLMLELSSYALPMFYDETFLGLVFRRNMLQLVQDSTTAVSSLMRRNFHIIHPHDRVIQARMLMLEKDVSLLPVLSEEDHVLGIVTEKEVLNDLIEFQKHVPEKNQKARIRQLPVSTAMKINVATVESEQPLGEAVQKMVKDQQPGLVVTEASKVVGIVSPHEVLEYIVGSFPQEQ